MRTEEIYIYMCVDSVVALQDGVQAPEEAVGHPVWSLPVLLFFPQVLWFPIKELSRVHFALMKKSHGFGASSPYIPYMVDDEWKTRQMIICKYLSPNKPVADSRCFLFPLEF